MSTTIRIQPMSKKSLMSICDCSRYELNKALAAIRKKKKEFGEYRGNNKLTRVQVEIFLSHCDIIPKEIVVE